VIGGPSLVARQRKIRPGRTESLLRSLRGMIQVKNATPRNKESQKPHRKPLSHGGQRCPRNVSWWKEEKRKETRLCGFAKEGSCRPFRHAIMARSAIKSMDRWIACQLDELGRNGRASFSLSGMSLNCTLIERRSRGIKNICSAQECGVFN
jgi:hypothetical protein